MSVYNIDIKQEKNNTTIRISGPIIWKDENGKVLSESKFKKMVDTRKYMPHIDTEKKTMILKKI